MQAYHNIFLNCTELPSSFPGESVMFNVTFLLEFHIRLSMQIHRNVTLNITDSPGNEDGNSQPCLLHIHLQASIARLTYTVYSLMSQPASIHT